MLTVDCQPLQSFARLSECKDQSSWSLENERKESETGRDGTERRAERLAAIQMQEYKHNTHTKKHTHTQTHTEMWAPRRVSDTDAARLIRVLSHSFTCSLVLEEKPDSCDVATRFCLAVVTM